MKIIVTGASGFIGGSLGACASEMGHEVLGISRSDPWRSDWNGQWLCANLENETIGKAIRRFGPDMIFHAAGAACVSRSFIDPMLDYRSSVETFRNLLESVRLSGCNPLVIFPSSGAVYGESGLVPAKESCVLAPISPYGRHKIICEELGMTFATEFGVNVLVCRIFSLFGVYQKRLLVWDLYQRAALKQRILRVNGSGAEERDFLHIDDLCLAILTLSNSYIRIGSAILNIASGRGVSVHEMARLISCRVCPESNIVFEGKNHVGNPVQILADVEEFKNVIGNWSPTSLEASLDLTISEWNCLGHSLNSAKL